MKARTMLICTAFTALACGGGGSGTGPEDPDPVTGPCPDVPSGITLGGGGLVRDATTTPLRRLVLQGGGLEEDFAATLFLEGAQGGNVVVLRATGSTTSYHNYFNFTLFPSPKPSSVIVVRTDQPSAAADTAVLCLVNLAEGIWLAGGDQWDYLGRWPSELHQALDAVADRDGAMGGTSAGAMALGEAAFDAEEGTVTSAEALADPLGSKVSISYPTFSQPELEGTMVDSHFAEREREGRLLAFLARFLVESGRTRVVGIGIDERVGLVVEGGTFDVWVREDEDGGVWFYEVMGPAVLEPGQPLELSGIRRARLGFGRGGSWPFDFDAAETVDLKVVGGVVGPG